jgi:hypothetical protein
MCLCLASVFVRKQVLGATRISAAAPSFSVWFQKTIENDAAASNDFSLLHFHDVKTVSSDRSSGYNGLDENYDLVGRCKVNNVLTVRQAKC